MPLRLGKRTATLAGAITIDDVEPLVAWLAQTPSPAVNLRRCTSLHTAALQPLLAARAKVSVPPDDAFLAAWVAPVLQTTASTTPPGKDSAP